MTLPLLEGGAISAMYLAHSHQCFHMASYSSKSMYWMTGAVAPIPIPAIARPMMRTGTLLVDLVLRAAPPIKRDETG